MRQAFRHVLAMLAFVLPSAAPAQLPPPSPPAQPPVPTVVLRSVTLQDHAAGPVRYERAGSKPIAYRISRYPTFKDKDAGWQTFSEGSVTTKVEGNTTWFLGSVPAPANAFPTAQSSSGCPANTILAAAFLQFRIRLASGQMLDSAIRGDSACWSIGG